MLGLALQVWTVPSCRVSPLNCGLHDAMYEIGSALTGPLDDSVPQTPPRLPPSCHARGARWRRRARPRLRGAAGKVSIVCGPHFFSSGRGLQMRRVGGGGCLSAGRGKEPLSGAGSGRRRRGGRSSRRCGSRCCSRPGSAASSPPTGPPPARPPSPCAARRPSPRPKGLRPAAAAAAAAGGAPLGGPGLRPAPAGQPPGLVSPRALGRGSRALGRGSRVVVS